MKGVNTGGGYYISYSSNYTFPNVRYKTECQ